MKTKIIMLFFSIILCLNVSAQFVGDGAPAATTTPQSTGKVHFTLKYGVSLPSGNFGAIPKRTATPQYKDGFMGATTGFFAELGFGLDMSKPGSKVGFYYFPLLAACWKTNLDWSDLGGVFEDDKIYVKSLRMIDIGQRYGISYNPVKDFSATLYYRPGLIIPLDFEITSGSQFQFTGTMSTSDKAPVLMLSSTPGISFRYSMAVLSFEAYFVKATYDITYKDNGIATPVNVTEMSKIPVRMKMVSLAFLF